jgi:hypothetical protein
LFHTYTYTYTYIYTYTYTYTHTYTHTNPAFDYSAYMNKLGLSVCSFNHRTSH